MTKKELIIFRDESYKDPPDPRCETCKHYSSYGGHCLAITINNKLAIKKVHLAGCCDLWESKSGK